MAAPSAPGSGDASVALASAVFELVRQTYVELHRREPAVPITASTSLDRDLQFDSLARVELVLRLERSFGVRMPDRVLESADSCGDLVQLLGEASPARMPAPEAVRVARDAAGGVAVPAQAATLLDVLDAHARQHPQRVHLRYLEDPLDASEGQALRYGELRERAECVAAGIQHAGVPRGQSIAIMLPTGLDYFVAYFGVLRAGCVPVPIYPPLRPSQIGEHVRRHAGILGNAQAAMLITVGQARAVAQLLSARVPTLQRIVTVDELDDRTARYVPVAVTADDTAFIQYTSGSTGAPKGVVLTHANLLANIRAFGAAAAIDADAVIVSWLPLYHDMGLIGAWLSSLYYGAALIVMSPLAFLARPERWLWAIHRFGGTHTVAPNFAYALCLRRIDDTQIVGLDLSSLRVLANGSEQVQVDTLETFARRFAAYGLDPGALLPVYGLAECSVGLLVPPLGRGPRVDRIDRAAFMHGGRAVPAAADDPNPLRFVSCGRPLPGHDVRIVDAAGSPLGERREGRLEFRGPSATRGYLRNPELTRALFHGDWLDSGDRAYAADGEFYVTGRIKDIIIRGGRNIYPDEIEDAIGRIAGIRRGCVVAFGIADAASGTERLVVLAETRESDEAARTRLRDAVGAAVVERLGEPPDEVVLVAPNSVLKTSSGKLRRAATRERYVAGELGRVPHGARWQLLTLAAGSVPGASRRLASETVAAAYAAWVWGLFAVIAPVAWALVALCRRPQRAWRVSRLFARALLRLAGIPLRVEGLDKLRGQTPCVLVSNHASYLDGLVLIAALPGHYRFVAKRELLRSRVARVFLNRLGTMFVERFSARRSVEDAHRLVDAVSAGASLIVFPEGTFGAAPGLLPFHLGAFVVAARTAAPVVPVVVGGTRSLLRAGRWAPRRGGASVTVCEPITVPDSADPFRTALALRDTARTRIAGLCNAGQEPGA